MGNEKEGKNSKSIKDIYIYIKVRAKLITFLLITLVLIFVIAFVGINLKIYNDTEKEYHVTNRGAISIDSIKEKSVLEVLEVSDIEYITNDKSLSDKVTSILETPGTGVFTVDLNEAEFIIDNVNSYVLVRLPKPELDPSNIKIDLQNVNQLMYKDTRWIFNGSVEDGENMAAQQLSEAQRTIQEDIQSNEKYFNLAKDSAKKLITQLIKSLNENIENIDIDVEFF